MPNITETILNLALGDEADSSRKKYRARFQNQGLGRLDKWLSHVQGAKNPIRARSAGKIAEPKSVILPQIFLPGEATDATDLAILSRLLQYRKVYLWRGPDQPLSKPLTSTEEFWEGRERHTPATQEEIEQEFGKLHLSEKHWLIVDRSRYRRLKNTVTQLQEPFAPLDCTWSPFLMLHEDQEQKIQAHIDTYLDLVNCQLDDSEMVARYIRSVDPMKITCLKLRAPTTKEIIALMKHFPALDEIIVISVTQQWLQGLERLPEKARNLHLIINGTMGKFETLPVHLFKKITYESATNTPIAIASDTDDKPSRLEELIIRKRRNVTLIGDNRTLKKVDLSEADRHELKNFKLIKAPALEELSVRDIRGLVSLSKRCTHLYRLKSLKISYSDKKSRYNFSLSYFLHLSVLHANFKEETIISCMVWLQELEKLTKLEDLRLNHSDITPTQLAKLSKLKVLYLKNENHFASKLTLKNHPELTHLKLDSCSIHIEETDFSEAPKLETIELRDAISEENRFDFSSCPQLKIICIQNKDLPKMMYVAQGLSGDANYTIVPPSSGSLQKLEVFTSKPVHIDFSNCTQLNALNVTFLQNYKDLKNCPHLIFVKLENTIIDESPLNLGPIENLDLINCIGDKLDFGQSNVKHLSIQISRWNGKSISLTNAKCLQSLDILSNLSINLEECINLRILKIQSCDWFEEKDLPNMDLLEELIITGECNIRALDLTKFPNLKHLVISGTNIPLNKITFPSKCLMENMELLYNSPSHEELDLSHCSHLKNFKMVCCSDIRLKGVPCEQLEELQIHTYDHPI